VGITDTARGNQERIKHDYMAWHTRTRVWGPGGVSFHLLVKGKDLKRRRQIPRAKQWLCSLCQKLRLSFYINRTFYKDQELLGRRDTGST